METKDDRVAIVGMSAILPCGESVRESWEAIREGLDCLQDLPADRVDITAYYDPNKTTKDKIYCKRGGFIPEYDFDAREFGLNMFQMEDSDANQTVTLLKVKEALEDAGVEPFTKKKKNIGCVLGIGGGQKASHEFYSRLNYVVVEKVLRKMNLPDEVVEAAVEKYKANFPEWRLDSFPGFLGNVTAGRCSNVFNMEGMNCVVDAACASSLIAIKVAIDELLHGDCDTMIAGATCTDNSIGMYMAFSKTPVFSTDQSVKAYDAKTKGMLIGEGSAMVVLKRYADAVRDGDEIHAVIRACASSSDGKAAGIYAPTVSGQEEALRRAYARAGVDPSTVTLVEGHGTGTPVGDRIELTALRNVFDAANKGRKETVAVGSIKSQIGHLKAVAGFAGLVKVVMALKHKTLPQTINVHDPPALHDGSPIQDSSLYINTMNRPWFTAPGVPRRAGISSFGFGGANYHAVLEEAEPEHAKPYRMNQVPQPVLLHASSASALASICDAQAEALQAAVSPEASKHADYRAIVAFHEAFKLHAGVPAGHARIGFVSGSAAATLAVLRAASAKLKQSSATLEWTLLREGVTYRSAAMHTPGSVAALFAGQGAQYTHMFADVAMNWPPFRSAVQEMDAAQVTAAAPKRLSEVLYPRKPYAAEPEQDNKAISMTINSQPALMACAAGAFEVFRQAGLAPDHVAGHSLGEFGALLAAGCASREELFRLVCSRAKAMQDVPKPSEGVMAAVIGRGADKLTLQGDGAWLANCNSPSQVVISGDKAAVERESSRLAGLGFRIIPLACEGAFHSPHMTAAQATFQAALDSLKISTPTNGARLYNNVSGKTCRSLGELRDCLGKHMTSPVLFQAQVENMYAAGARIFVEFGPKQVLSKLVGEILADKSDFVTVAVNSSSSKDSDVQLREAAAKLAVLGVPLANFDPWELCDARRLRECPRSKTTLRLSAATYVSNKTLAAREKVMEDNCDFSSLFASGPASQEMEREIANLRAELEAAQRQLDTAKTQLARKQVQDPTADRQRDMIAKHRSTLAAMVKEFEALASGSPCAVPFAPVVDTAVEDVPFADKVSTPPPQVTSAPIAELARAEAVVMEVLAAKTGYEVDMIEADMLLDAELGIDSVKRIEILAAVQAQLGVEAKDVDALSRTRTVGEVVEAMKAEIGAAGPNDAQAASGHLFGTGCEDLSLCSASVVEIARCSELALERPMDRPILIVSDGSALPAALASRLGSCAVILTTAGETDQSVRSTKHVDMEGWGEADLVRALEAVESRFGVPGGVVVLERASETARDQLGFALLLAKHSSKALNQQIPGGRACFVGVSRIDGKLGLSGACAKGKGWAEAAEIAQQGAVAGLCKTLDLEWPHVFARSIDIELGANEETAAQAIFEELSCPDLTVREAGYTKDGKRWTTEARPVGLGKPKQALRSSDVFLVSGGARGITPVCVRELAKSISGGTFVLLGRSPLADDPAWACGVEEANIGTAAMAHLKAEFAAGRGPKPTPKAHKALVGSVLGAREVLGSLESIRAQGARAEYVSCDVSCAERVKAVVDDLERRVGAVTGVVHASGVLRDKSVERLELADFEVVYGTKVDGLLNLLQAVDRPKLRHLVLFSSLAGFHGNTGQAVYAMANEALNKMAFHLETAMPGLSVKTIGFGPWDGGMVNDALKAHFASMGVQIIPLDGGAETVSRIIGACSPTQVLVGNWGLPPVVPNASVHKITVRLGGESANPFLSSHTIQGRKVLPMTVALGLLAEAARGLYVGHQVVGIEDAQVFQGVVLDKGATCEVQLRRESSTASPSEVVLSASLNVFAAGKVVPAYRAHVVLGASGPRTGGVQLEPKDLGVDADPACSVGKGALYDGRTLFHGPAFQYMDEVLRCSPAELAVRCRVVPSAAQDRGQFVSRGVSYDPFLNDTVFQALLVWARLVRDSASLPSNVERISFHGQPPSEGEVFYTTLKLDSAASGPLDPIAKAQFFLHRACGAVFASGRASVVLNKALSF